MNGGGVVATFTANISGYMNAMKQMGNATKETTSNTGKSGTGFLKMGALAGLGASTAVSAFNGLKRGITGIVGELESSIAVWSTFEQNMAGLGKSKGQIKGIEKELQSFAQKTIYSSADMASTYSQLAAVGVKGTTQLVKGMAGLAASATDPQQAMKTLSQQMVQVAAKPKVQWQDFRLMVEQAPGAMASVAKHMGMSLDQLIAKIQDGKISSKEFMKAVAETGTNKTYSGMATQYKNIGQALDGLRETVGIKLKGAYKEFAAGAVSSLSRVIDAIGKIDATGMARKLKSAFNGLMTTLAPLGTAIGGLFQTIWGIISNLPWGTIATVAGAAFKVLVSTLTAVVNIAKSLMGNDIFKMFAVGAVSAIGAAKGVALVAGAFTKVITAVSSVVRIFTAVISVIKNFAMIVQVAGSVFKAFGLILGMNPFVLIIAAIAAVVAALVFFFTKTKLGQEIWKKFLDFLPKAWDAVKNAAVTIWNGIANFFVGLWNGIVSVATAAWTAIVTFLTTIWQGIAPLAMAYWNVLVTFYTTLWTIISTLFVTAWNVITTVLTTVWTAIVTVAMAIWNGLVAYYTTLWTIVSTIFTTVWNTIVTVLTTIWTTVVSVAMTIWNGLVLFFSALWTGVSTVFTTVWTTISSFLTGLWNGIKSVASSVWNGITSAISSAVSAVSSVVMSIWNGLSSFITGLWNSVRSIVSSAWNGIRSVITSIASGIVSSVRGTWSAFTGIVSNVVNGIRNGFNALRSFSLASAGRAIMDSFMSGLRAVWGKIQSFVGNIAGWIKDHKGPVSYDAKLLIPAGSAMMAGLNGGLVSGFSQVQSTVSSMAGSIARDVNGLVDTNRMGVDVNSSNVLDQSERVQPTFVVQNSLDGNGLNTIVKSAEANDTAKNTYFR